MLLLNEIPYLSLDNAILDNQWIRYIYIIFEKYTIFFNFPWIKEFSTFSKHVSFPRRINRSNKRRNCSQVAICIIYDIHVIS